MRKEKRGPHVAWAIKRKTGQLVHHRGVVDVHPTRRSAEKFASAEDGETIVRVEITESRNRRR